ncbi:LOW QUALITY PROTEIN: matrix metalloproteinase-28-like [Denticeps clupeoides]|uniref:LOW QUALITY PROTEIN: matrix metalloproteinase-28-like n=1 Tax=Denticeps clupeoides TaxID=299321 RepID=UPI0010A3B312|nr:LOW QUALITY PROTEIN: matrix metalloproteinase-28-like [Denticeps clupeoides]
MGSRCARCALLLLLLCAPPSATAGARDALNFLEKYGYLDQTEHQHEAGEVKSAVREFQWLSHLPVTGKLDSSTLEKMAEPRCSVRDSRSHRSWARRVKGVFTGHAPTARPRLRRKRFSHPGDKWYKRHLTYGIVNWPRQLSHESVQLAVGAAFQLWSNVSGLVFQEVTRGPADIRLAFYAGEHDDGLDNAFDGPGGALAHAFFPRRGEAHFDMAERWTLSGLKGHNLFLVVAHEIGHTLGLEHSPVRHALMSPYYKKLGHALLLSWDDVAAVQQLYGTPPGGALVQLRGRTISSAMQDWDLHAASSTRPPYCRGAFDAITTDQDDGVLVFWGSLYWTVSPRGNASRPAPLRQRWTRLPAAVEAAAFCPLDKKIYFFKGGRLWRYSGSDLDPGFPRRTQEMGLPRHPDCAFFYAPLGHMVLFKGSRYFVLNVETLRPEPYYPRRLGDWKGVGPGANGGVTRPDGHLYLFQEQRFWRFDPGRVRVTGTGRWAEELDWTGCAAGAAVTSDPG